MEERDARWFLGLLEFHSCRVDADLVSSSSSWLGTQSVSLAVEKLSFENLFRSKLVRSELWLREWLLEVWVLDMLTADAVAHGILGTLGITESRFSWRGAISRAARAAETEPRFSERLSVRFGGTGGASRI